MKKIVRQIRRIRLKGICWVLFSIVVLGAFTPIFLLVGTMFFLVIIQEYLKIIWEMLTYSEDYSEPIENDTTDLSQWKFVRHSIDDRSIVSGSNQRLKS